VRDDLNECLRLCCIPAVRDHLDSDPCEKTYVHGTILSIRLALAGVGKYVESVRIEAEQYGDVSLHTRFEWVLRHQTKLLTRQLELDTCQKSLLQATARLALFLHAANPPGGQNGLPNYDEATKEKVDIGSMDAKRMDAQVGDPTIFEQNDELVEFLTTRNRRMRRGKMISNSSVDISKPGEILTRMNATRP
jgi:hypothetical protein